jgi:modification methylase
LNQVLQGDCLEILASLPAESIDLVFADPPYNLQLHQELWRPNLTRVEAVDAAWDQFPGFQAYDDFSRRWLAECRRVLKRTGTLWVIGTYHNIHRLGVLLQDLGFWLLNDLVWIKLNPMPNFRGVRFTNAHETLIWAQKERGAHYTFNYHAMKALNDGLQMRSDWYFPICSGPERLRNGSARAHPTQKPTALLHRILQASSNPGDIILDPFFGTGTTGVVAHRLGRHWIGVERDPEYVLLAQRRLEAVVDSVQDVRFYHTPNPRLQPRIPFGLLIEHDLVKIGQALYLGQRADVTARVMADGSLEYNGQRGSIHQLARLLRQAPCNGWEQWYYRDESSGELLAIDHLRQKYRALIQSAPPKDA